MILPAEPICVAQAIFHEARNDSYIGKVYTAELVYNRARDKKISTCQVIRMKGQFPGWNKIKIPKTELKSWKEACDIAKRVRYKPSPIRYMVLRTVYHNSPKEHTLYKSKYHVFYNRFNDPVWKSANYAKYFPR